jgi:pimeloyl-ACP methyl ester carboxylesterase
LAICAIALIGGGWMICVMRARLTWPSRANWAYPELEALVTSDNMYPGLNPEAVRGIKAPTLLLSGERSQQSQKSIDDELERLLPEKQHQRIIVRDADHGMWFQQPEHCRNAVLEFLRGR